MFCKTWIWPGFDPFSGVEHVPHPLLWPLPWYYRMFCRIMLKWSTKFLCNQNASESPNPWNLPSTAVCGCINPTFSCAPWYFDTFSPLYGDSPIWQKIKLALFDQNILGNGLYSHSVELTAWETWLSEGSKVNSKLKNFSYKFTNTSYFPSGLSVITAGRMLADDSWYLPYMWWAEWQF